MNHDFAEDVAAVQRLEVVPRILDLVCRTTGVRFAAVARVTEERWIACAVRDDIEFGLKPGGELKVQTTICDEIRRSKQLVAIDDVAASPRFCAHHTPKMYGFQSYISVPLCRPDGTFFGTLCAIDPHPAHVENAEIIGMFTLFADLIGCHLALQDLAGDLRGHLGAIGESRAALGEMTFPDDARREVAVIDASAARIASLVANLTNRA